MTALDPFGVREARELVKAREAQRDAAIVRMVAQGCTHRDVAAVCGVTPARVTQVVTRERDRAWGPAFVSRAVPVTHETMAADMRLAQHAQALRCEAATGLAAREVRAFYGSPHESTPECGGGADDAGSCPS